MKFPGVDVTVYSVAMPSVSNVTVAAPVPARVAVGAARAVPRTNAADVLAVAGSVPKVGVTVKVSPVTIPVTRHVCVAVNPGVVFVNVPAVPQLFAKEPAPDLVTT